MGKLLSCGQRLKWQLKDTHNTLVQLHFKTSRALSHNCTRKNGRLHSSSGFASALQYISVQQTRDAAACAGAHNREFGRQCWGNSSACCIPRHCARCHQRFSQSFCQNWPPSSWCLYTSILRAALLSILPRKHTPCRAYKSPRSTKFLIVPTQLDPATAIFWGITNFSSSLWERKAMVDSHIRLDHPNFFAGWLKAMFRFWLAEI